MENLIMVKHKGTVYINKRPRVWYVWFPGQKNRQPCYPQPLLFWKGTKARLIKKGYDVVELGNLEVPPSGTS